MKRNPSKSKIGRKNINVSKVFETLTADDFKTTLANFEYTHMLKRTWSDISNGSKRAGR